MTTKQEEQLSPNKLKSNETEGYNLHGFNISNLKNNDMLLVRNFSELQLIVKKKQIYNINIVK